MGLAFAIGWTPCIGPVLGTILLVAGTEQTVGQGAVLLAVYSLGLGLPFLFAGFFAGPFIHVMRRFRGHLGTVERVMGGLLVVTGVLFMTGQITTFSFWIISMFPALGQIG
jgi:cytochrome c-type biogenesis protein